jgi:hypothetical protein
MIDTEKMGHLEPQDGTSEGPRWDTAVSHPSDLLFRSHLSSKTIEGEAGAEVAPTPSPYCVPPEMMGTLEAINAQAIAARQAPPTALARTRPKAQVNGHFIKGPIPLPWLMTAVGLGIGAVKAGHMIWYAAGLWGDHYEISIQPRLWGGFFKDRKMLYRALERLESAGLIDVDRKRGRSPIVSIKVGGETYPTLNTDYAREIHLGA